MPNKDTAGFPEKYKKKLQGSAWLDDANNMNDDELKKAIIDSESAISETENERGKDGKLKQAKDLAKELNGSYKDTIDYQMAKIKYALFLLESRGKL